MIVLRRCPFSPKVTTIFATILVIFKVRATNYDDLKSYDKIYEGFRLTTSSCLRPCPLAIQILLTNFYILHMI